MNRPLINPHATAVVQDRQLREQQRYDRHTGISKEQFRNWAKDRGWEEDKFGHLHKTVMTGAEQRAYRFKVSTISVRYEVQVCYPGDHYSLAKNEWMRLRSGYLKDLHIGEDGKLSGLKC